MTPWVFRKNTPHRVGMLLESFQQMSALPSEQTYRTLVDNIARVVFTKTTFNKAAVDETIFVACHKEMQILNHGLIAK